MKTVDGKKLRKVVTALAKAECEVGWAEYRDCVDAHRHKQTRVGEFCWPCRVRFAIAKDEKK